MQYLSLFSGIGGFELGIGKAGKCVGYSEIDKHAIQIYEQHFPLAQKLRRHQKTSKQSLFPTSTFSAADSLAKLFQSLESVEDLTTSEGLYFFDIARILRAKQTQTLLIGERQRASFS